MPRLVLLTAAGLALALGVTGSLSVTGNLDGPSLLPTGGAVLEAIVFASAGGLVGLVGGVLIMRR